MSKDIRSYFKPQSNSKGKVSKNISPIKSKSSITKFNIEDDDDDNIPDTPEQDTKSKSTQLSRKRRVLNDSSDEETSIKISKQPPNSITKKVSINTSKPKKLKSDDTKLTCTYLDVYANQPVKRSEPLKRKEKKVEPLKTEVGIHSDEEFEKSLLELDSDQISVSPSKNKINIDNKISIEKETKSIHQEDSTLKIKESPSKDDLKSKYYHKQYAKNLADFEIKGEKPVKKQNSKSIKNGKLISPKKDEKKKDASKISKNILHKDNADNITKQENSKSILMQSSVSPNKLKSEKGELSDSTHDKVFNSTNRMENSKYISGSPKKSNNEKKRDFSEFLGDDSYSQKDEYVDNTPKNKKIKVNRSFNESVLSDEERYERKRHSAVLYQNYLNRTGPKHLGSKDMPEGKPDCLKNCAFLLTGVLDSFEREEIVSAITRFGGTLKNSISKKVTHVLAGDEAGPAKIAKAQEFGIKIINEDQFLEMVKNPPNNKSSEKSKSKTENKLCVKKSSHNHERKRSTSRDEKKDKSRSMPTIVIDEPQICDKNKTLAVENNVIKSSSFSEPNRLKVFNKDTSGSSSQSEEIKPSSSNVEPNNQLMWVEKYKPQTVKQIIGQHTEGSCAKKLTKWLTEWYINRKAKIPKPSPWAKNDDGGYFKAALLSGPPGVGKTTTVSLVCKDLGFDVVEFNASDTRNKGLIKDQVAELLTTTSLSGFAKGNATKGGTTKKHVLVMDEVDGMAGNEDRGGLQELISLIKITAVPIICMCNDRSSQKMRTLVNYCFDLRVSRPKYNQIQSAMRSVCFKEGIKIPPESLSQIITSAQNDIRQVLNQLSLWAINSKEMDTDQVKKDINIGKKDIVTSPWEAIRKVLTKEEHKTMTFIDKMDLFFSDYSIMPLFVQENYLRTNMNQPSKECLNNMGIAADSISLGDIVEAKIRRNNAWGLLPVQACFSTVIPGHAVSGYLNSAPQFPGWLGKNSRANKVKRLCQEIHAHTRLSTSGSKSSICLDYAKGLRDAIVLPLVKDKAEGIPKSLEVLQSYHLLREDLEALTEISLWPGQRDPMVLVDSKVKAAMTRTYNKEAMALPYAPGKIRRGRGANGDDSQESPYQSDDDSGSDSDPNNDAMIKKKRKNVQKQKDLDAPSSSTAEKKKGKGKKTN